MEAQCQAKSAGRRHLCSQLVARPVDRGGRLELEVDDSAAQNKQSKGLVSTVLLTPVTLSS